MIGFIMVVIGLIALFFAILGYLLQKPICWKVSWFFALVEYIVIGLAYLFYERVVYGYHPAIAFSFGALGFIILGYLDPDEVYCWRTTWLFGLFGGTTLLVAYLVSGELNYIWASIPIYSMGLIGLHYSKQKKQNTLI